MGKIACAHPGKMGDALYALPAARELARRHGSKVDFYTSPYCAPLTNLIEAQEYIDRVVIAHDYVLKDFRCGAYPWSVSVPGGYDAVYQMGLRDYPAESIPDHIAVQCGLPRGLPVRYDFDLPPPKVEGPYIVTAPRGHTAYSPTFRAIADHCPIKVVEIGASGDGTGSPRAIDKTGLDMHEVLPWISGAQGFVGLHSAMLVLANGFPINKIVPQGDWDMRHVVRSVYHQYPQDLDAEEVLKRLRITMTYCKTLDPSDYHVFHEAQHVDTIRNMVGTPGGRADHPHRNWEYGLVLHALREHGCKTILDVGGGGSVFAPAAAWIDMQITEVDSEDYQEWVNHQSRVVSKPIDYQRCDFMDYAAPHEFDAVTSISVLEHVPDDVTFFRKLASHVKVGGILALTVDFWPDGEKRHPLPGQLRCYNQTMLEELFRPLENFETVGVLDYSHLGLYVNNYTFASLVLKRVA